MICSPQIQKYFDNIQEEVQALHTTAAKARSLLFDPEPQVDIKLAKNMAERVTGLISVVAPQVGESKVTERIIELEKKYAPLDWRVALEIALEVAEGKFCAFKDKKEAMEIGIRTGFAYQTGGIVSAPLEGFIELKIKKTQEGKEYFAPCYAGPIRGAGGTAAAFSLLITDFVRKKLGYAKYDPTENEINRFKSEIYDYNERVTNLQYLPSLEEIEFLCRHIPIEVDGDPTETVEVSNYKDLPRVETNRIRGGICLVLAEGLAQKSPKLWKRLEQWGIAMGMEDWQFLGEFVKLQKEIKARKKASDMSGQKKEKISQNFTFIADTVAGRPILTHPMRVGGFRLRYGRGRTTGFSAAAINPAVMYLLKKYIAIGTQLKVERPGKAAAIATCTSIEGAIVKLRDGSVIRVNTIDVAKQYASDVSEILFLGDFLFNYGDFSENGHMLIPCGYNEEWWERELEKSSNEKQGSYDFKKIADEVGMSYEEVYGIVKSINKEQPAEKIISLCKTMNIPLHPYYTFHWKQISNDDLLYVEEKLRGGKNREEEYKLIIAYDLRFKKIAESIGIPHLLVNNEFMVFKKNEVHVLEALFKLGTDQRIASTMQHGKTVIENLSLFSGITIRDKSGTFIGARMGRPEKAKIRELTGSPHVLFPVGDEGGRLRSFQAAMETGKVVGDFPLYRCISCDRDTIYPKCDNCFMPAKKRYYCKLCGVVEQEKCVHGKPLTYKEQNLDIKRYFSSCLKQLKTSHYPDLIKGVRGTASKDHIPEHLMKGILRAKHDVYVNKDGTIRCDMSELPLTHFKPKEIHTPIEKLKLLGYVCDIHGAELSNDEQILEIKPQDVILPACSEALDEPIIDVLFRVSLFIDELLEKLYGLPSYYNLKNKHDLTGHLVLALAPHISAGMIGRIVGFSNTQGFIAHPLFHAALRRDCDGDEASVSLLLDCFLNFSSQYLPNTRGAKTMDAPLVLTSLLNPSEVDDQAHGLDVVWRYPLEFYEAALQYKMPWEVPIEQLNKRLGKETQYEKVGFTHDTEDFNLGVACSAYKSLPSMEEKLQGQMEIATMIRAVNDVEVAELVINKHFLKDIKGNLRKFSQQQFRCVKCNEKFRRPPLIGKCTKCGGKILFTIHESSVIKYLGHSLNLAEKYNVTPYMKQNLELLKRRIESVFGKEKETQTGLAAWASA